MLVDALVLGMKGVADRLQIAGFDPRFLQRHLDLVGLAPIAHVGRILQTGLALEFLLLREPRSRLLRQVGGVRLEAREPRLVQIDKGRADEIIADIGHQSAKRRQHAGRRRHDDAIETEITRQQARRHRSRAAERQQREVSRIGAVPREQLRYLQEHARHGHLDDGLRCRLDAHPELARRFPLTTLPRPVEVERHRAVAEISRSQKSAHRIGIRDGRVCAAAAVAGRPRVGARALRPDLQHVELIHARNRSAARADRRHRHCRNVDLKVSDPLARAERRLAIDG